jgi:hypothetical protein
MAINNQFITGSIFYDQQKAFNCVDHKISSKLEFYGVTGKPKLYVGKSVSYKSKLRPMFLNYVWETADARWQHYLVLL